ncbi:hypothetical protein, partial [Enterococcus faecium]|uniref:hypothetical protein n=1 Tax=Enterococcus faecium TaxID=1352 RepID=UPI0030C8C1C3
MNKLEETPVKSGQFGQTIQVRLVLKSPRKTTKKSSDARLMTGATQSGMECWLSCSRPSPPEDVRPNAVSKKRRDYPTEWEGPDFGWHTYI